MAYGLILFLLPLVLIHEFGHFITAKWLGFDVREFSIGLGPKLFQKKYKGVVYSISLFPFGGKVVIAGESPDTGTGKNGEFLTAHPMKRILVSLAGPLFNVFLTLGLFLFLGFGSIEYKDGTILTNIQKTMTYSIKSTAHWGGQILNGVGSLFDPQNESDENGLQGPIALTKTAVATYRASSEIFMEFLAVISLNLAFINLLPIPLLDGGHIFMALVEWCGRKKIPSAHLKWVNRFGIYLILTMTFTAIGQDLLAFFP